jgi:hypothetical protein
MEKEKDIGNINLLNAQSRPTVGADYRRKLSWQH